jgi:hypothetical protein
LLTRTQRLIVILVQVLPVAAMLVWMALYVSNQVRRTVASITPMVVHEFERRLQREVAIGRITNPSPGVVVLEDVRIAEGRTLATGTMVSAASIVIRYDLRGLLGGQGAGAISRVEVVRPHLLLVRRRDGSLNVSALFRRPPGPPGPPFTGIVHVTGGTVLFQDYLGAPPTKPTIAHVRGVDAAIDAAGYPRYEFRVTAAGRQGEFAAAHVVGVYDSAAAVARMDVRATGLNAPFAALHFRVPGDIRLLDGTLRLALGVTLRRIDSRWATALTGVVAVNGVDALIPRISAPVRDTTGNVILTRDQAAMSLTGDFAGSPVRVTGTVTDLRRPRLDIFVASRTARFARAVEAVGFLSSLRIVGLHGSGPLEIRITGPTSNPTILVSATIPRATYRGYLAENVTLEVRYRAGVLDLRFVRARIAGGTVVASGIVKTNGVPVLDIRGRAVGVSLSRVPLPVRERVTGTASARFLITGTAAKPVVTASVSVVRGAIRGIVVSAPSIEITYRRGRIEAVAELAVRYAGGVVRLAGRITPSTISARYVAEGVDLARLGELIGLEEIRGILYSVGRVEGSIVDPTVSGTAEVFRGSYQSFDTDYARVEFIGNRRSLSVRQGVVRIFPAEVNIAGTVSGLQSRRIEFQGSIQANRLRVRQVLAAIDREVDITGVIAADFGFSGAYLRNSRPGVSPFVDTTGSGTVALEDGTAFGYPISTASAVLSYDGTVLTVADAVLSSQEARLTANGTVSLATTLVDLSFELSGFDLARLHDKLGSYVSLAGKARATGAVTGPWTGVRIAVDAGVDAPVLNSVRFDQVGASAVISGSTLTSYSLRLMRGKQLYELEGNDFNTTTRCMSATTVRVSDASIPDMWAILTSSPYLGAAEAERLRRGLRTAPRPTAGVLDGSATITGCLSNPSGLGRIEARNVVLDGKQIDSLVVQASSTEGVVSLAEFRATSEAMVVEATPIDPGAPVYRDGQIAVSVAAYNIDLTRLRPWLGEHTPSGTLTARFDLEGPAREPTVIGSVEVADPGYGGFTFDRLRASRIELAGDTIRVADVILATNGHQIVARGRLPWSWSALTIPSDQPLQFTAELVREDLSFLAAFVPQIEAGTTSGPVQAVVDVGGTLADPNLSGLVQVQNGSIGLRGFRNVFNNVNIDMLFDGNQVLVNKLSAQSSLGGSVEVVPGGFVRIGTLDTSEVGFLVAARGLVVSERDALGYQEDVSLTVDAGLSVTGMLRSPLIADRQIDSLAGGITIRNSSVAFAVPETPPAIAQPTFAVNPRFDVGVSVGDDVTIRPPRMSLVVGGEGLVTGTLSRPDVRFQLGVRRGSLALGASSLRVLPGSGIEVTYAPPAEPQLVLRNFQANTSVTATGPTGRRERYVITITVSGPIERMQIGLSSSPPGLSREQMLAALGHVEGLFATAEGSLQRELANVLTAVGASTLFAPVERVFVEQLGFEQFSLEYSAVTPLSLYLSRRLFDSFYISYYQRLTGQFVGLNNVSYQIELSYRFRNLYQVSFGIDDQQTSTIQVGYQRAIDW